MEALIRVADSKTTTTVFVEDESTVRVYRVEDLQEEVVAKKDDEITGLGVRDVTVSREFDDSGEPGYIEFFIENNQLYVRDSGSKTGATQKNPFGEIDISDGEPSVITGNCTVKIGYSTTLEVEVQQRAEPDGNPIPYKADLVLKICDDDDRSYKEIKSELKELKEMMEHAAISNDRYDSILEDVEKALQNLRNVDSTIDSRSDQNKKVPDDVVPMISGSTRRARNYFFNSWSKIERRARTLLH